VDWVVMRGQQHGSQNQTAVKTARCGLGRHVRAATRQPESNRSQNSLLWIGSIREGGNMAARIKPQSKQLVVDWVVMRGQQHGSQNQTAVKTACCGLGHHVRVATWQPESNRSQNSLLWIGSWRLLRRCANEGSWSTGLLFLQESILHSTVKTTILSDVKRTTAMTNSKVLHRKKFPWDLWFLFCFRHQT